MPSTRNRYRVLAGALFCLLVVLAIAVLYRTDVKALDELDNDLGAGPEHWTYAHPLATHFLLFVQVAFTTLPMTVYTVITAGVLVWRKHVRAAVWTVGVMLSASLSTYVLKGFLQRKRPVWPDPVTTLSSFSFPSGHATGAAAAAGVVIVLAGLFVRRRRLRRTLTAVALGLALLVGLDRVFLGVHNPSDVVAGYAVGAFWVLLWLAVYDPAPRAKQLEAFSTPVPTTKQLAVILNPVKVEDVEAFRLMVEASAAGAGWGAPAWYTTTVEDPGRSMAEQAAISGAELVVVCGGDGTVRTVAVGGLPATSVARRGDVHHEAAARAEWISLHGVVFASARSARSSRSSRGPASRSASCPPAPGTCWPATSGSRCSCRPPSTSP